MRILFLTRLFHPNVGGVEKHVYEIAIRLIARGHEVTVITERLPGTKEEENYNGIKIYRIPVGIHEREKKWRIWMWILQHKNLFHTDIVHCHDVFFWYLPLKLLHPLQKVYTTFHGYEGYPLRKNTIRVRKLSEVLSRGNICIGLFMKKWYGTKPTIVSYGGVDLSNIKKQSLLKHSAIFIGRLDNQTGIQTYCEALSLIQKQFPEFSLSVFGDGPYRSKLPLTISAKGFIVNAEVFIPDYEFAFVSRYLAMLESLAAKRLVIAVYDNPIKEDYLRMTPYADYIIIAKDAGEIAERVAYYLSHQDEAKRLIEEGYAWAREQTWDNLTDMYLRLWKR